jgi:hypothetical protein
MPFLNIFKKDPTAKLGELDFETATEEDIRKACEKAAGSDVKNRLNAFHIYIKKLEPKTATETPEETGLRRRKLTEKATLLQNILNDIELKEKAQRQQADSQYSEKTALEQLPNIRYSYDSTIRPMQSQGIEVIPLNAVKWETPTSTIIEIRCNSGKVRKLDISKFPASWWKNLTQSRLTPIFITAESAGTQREKNTLEPLWIDKRTFHGEDKIIAIPTIIAIMLV